MRLSVKLGFGLMFVALHSLAAAFSFSEGKIPLQVGAFSASQGKTQHINIQNLIGDQYTKTDESKQNVLLGVGYYLNGLTRPAFNLLYGIDAFYLAKTTVRGNIVQENLFTNLAYQYHVTNVPVYAAAKAELNNFSDQVALTLDGGLGPNFIHTAGYREKSLDGGITIPDHLFSGKSTTAFSAMAGIGLKINNLFGHVPFECGYRFFYLGKGHFNGQNSQLLNTLNTGNNYAQAVLCAVTVP